MQTATIFGLILSRTLAINTPYLAYHRQLLFGNCTQKEGKFYSYLYDLNLHSSILVNILTENIQMLDIGDDL